MDRASDINVVLLSIHPKYADAIFSGSKKVEFRKIRFSRPVSYIVVYVTSPICKVVGYLEVDRIDLDTPSSNWRKYGQLGAISSQDYKTYYAGKESSAAILIKMALKLDRPLRLNELWPDIRPPQSYQYLPRDLFEDISDRSLIPV